MKKKTVSKKRKNTKEIEGTGEATFRKNTPHFDYWGLILDMEQPTLLERLKGLKKITGVSRQHLHKLRTKEGWDAKFMTVKVELNQKIEKAAKEAVALQRGKIDGQAIATSDLAMKVRVSTKLALIVNEDLLRHAARMVSYYTSLIDDQIEQAGQAINKLTFEQKQMIAFYESKITYYKKDVMTLVAPGQISGYLKALGVDKELEGGGAEGTRITPDGLLKMIAQLGFKSPLMEVKSVQLEYKKAIIGVEGSVPDITAKK